MSRGAVCQAMFLGSPDTAIFGGHETGPPSGVFSSDFMYIDLKNSFKLTLAYDSDFLTYTCITYSALLSSSKRFGGGRLTPGCIVGDTTGTLETLVLVGLKDARRAETSLPVGGT